MSKLHHVVTDLHQVYLTEMEAKIKPQMGKKEAPSSESGGGEGGGDDNIKKQARQLAYDTRYKARREDIPLERAWSQVLQNSSASAPVKELAKNMIFGGGVKKEEFEIEEGNKVLKKGTSSASSKKDMVLVTPAKGFGKPYRRYADLKKKHELRKNPQIQSVVGTAYGTPYEGERKKGEQTASALQSKKPEKKAKKDYDGDGRIESGTDEWKGSRDKAIKKSVAKKVAGVKEEFSSWREDLSEVMDVLDKEKNDKKISEKKVNNKIVINPPLKEAMSSLGGEVISVDEINEDYLFESVDIATEYFFNQGLNEYGLDMVIEELGLEKFTDFVFYVAEDYELTEARRSGRIEPVTKTGKSIGSLKGGAKASAIRAKQKEKAARDSTVDRPSGMTAALRSQSSVAKKITTDKGKKSVEKAKATQGSKKPLKDRIAKGVLGAVKAYQQGMERHKAATATAGKALKVAAKGASEFGKGVASGVKATGKAAQTAHRVLKNSYEMDEAVYGGEPKKPAAPADTRMTVTAADKKANTKAWQKYKAGHPSYKAASHLDEEESDRMRDRQLERGGMGARSSTSSAKKSSTKSQTDAETKASMEKYKKTSQNALDLVRRSMGKGLMQQYEPEGDIVDEAKKMKGDDPCWKGYEMVGTKKKGGKEVPNCVPKEAVNPYAVGMSVAMKATGDKPPLKKSTINKAHKIAKKVDEAISTVTGQQGNPVAGKQQDTEQKQTKNAQAKLNKILSARKNLQQAQTQAIRSGVTNIGDSFEVDGQDVSELNRYEKETGTSSGSLNMPKGRPTQKGGDTDPALRSVRKTMRSMTGKPAGQRKKVPGKKPPAAGEYGAPESPAQKVAKRRAAAQRSQDNMSSRFD